VTSESPAAADDPARPDGPRALRFAIPESTPLLLEIVDVAPLTPNVRRLSMRVQPGSTGVPLSYAPGQDLSLSVTGPGDAPVNRRYTISSYDPATSIAELDIVLHGDGPGSHFAAAARSGDAVEAIGPRGKITLVQGASNHVFVADEASLAAAAAMIRALNVGEKAMVLLDLAGKEELRPLGEPAGVDVEVHVLERGGSDAQDPSRLLDALGSLEGALDPDTTQAYVFGEYHVVTALRQRIGGLLGASHVMPKPYWRAGRPNASHGEPPKDQ